jgi:signal peptidase I
MYNTPMTESDFSNPVSLMSADLFKDLSTDLLRQGKSVRFHAPGRSMYPSIREGEAITVEPVSPSAVQTGDILLYQSGERLVAHRVARIIKTKVPRPYSLDGERPSDNTHPSSRVPRLSFVLRGDTWGKEDPEPVEDSQILGKVIRVERNGRPVNPYSRKAQIRLLVHTLGSRIKKWVL